MDIRQTYKGIPLYAWWGGTGVLLGTSYILWKRHKAKVAAAAAAQGQGSGSATSIAGLSPDMNGPIPGWAGLQAALGALGGSSPSGPLTGYDTYGTPVYGLPGSGTSDPVTAPSQPVPATSPPAPVVSAGNANDGAQTANAYQLGQVVNPVTGERIAAQAFSKVYGWLNETNLGGIYTGGGGSRPISDLPYGGSYLGYAAQTANPAAETAAHGQFGKYGPYSLALLPGGGFTEINDRQERYNFGS